ncbi:class I SAM-dependent methyltransferase [Formosa sp. S-31]|uniref:class I SAM-dependent methyltransferase n=1 Tax=Formosa sp. S-31 TaxID=2790949 RepID=UPI003EB9A536
MEEHATYKSHWDQVYKTKKDEALGWYETDLSPTLNLIEKTQLGPDARLLNVGAGTTTLIDALIAQGFTSILANDISPAALESLETRIKTQYQQNITCIEDDLSNPKILNNIAPVDLWIDRAVLHFFNEHHEQDAYFKLLNTLVKPQGFALIAVFALNGAETCCALPVKRYSTEDLQLKLSPDFTLISSFNYTFINPFGGERPYIYTLFQKH